MGLGGWRRDQAAPSRWWAQLLPQHTHFHHNRAFLLIVLGGVALLPSGRVLSIDAWWRPPRDDRAPLWPVVLLRFEHATTYFASGFSKLIDPDWWGGTVTWDRVLRYRDALDRSIAPGWVKELVTQREFHWVFAKVNVLTELFLALALWYRPTRLCAVCGDRLSRHDELTARVQVFSCWGSRCSLCGSRRRRAILSARPRPLAARRALLGGAVRALDWLARFRLEDAAPCASDACVSWTAADASAARRGGAAGADPAAGHVLVWRAAARAFDVLRGGADPWRPRRGGVYAYAITPRLDVLVRRESHHTSSSSGTRRSPRRSRPARRSWPWISSAHANKRHLLRRRERLGYWKFLPDPRTGVGPVPLWGFGTVTRSTAAGWPKAN